MKSKIAAPVVSATVCTIAEAPVSAELQTPQAACRPRKAPAIPATMFLVKSSRPSVGTLALVANPTRITVTIVMMILHDH